LKLDDVKPSLWLDNLEYQERSGVKFYSCNKAPIAATAFLSKPLEPWLSGQK
jgi:hypothetical protein